VLVWAGALLGLVYGAIVLAQPADTFWATDMGLSYLTARALADSRGSSIHINISPVLAGALHRFFPFRFPQDYDTRYEPSSDFANALAIVRGGNVTSAYPIAFPIVSALPLTLGGTRGLALFASLCVLLATLLYARAFAPALASHPTVLLYALALGLATPLCFYAINWWSHAPALALLGASTLALVRWARDRT
jgi:hypothetical protein